MPVPHISTNFADLLDPRFERIFDEEFAQLPSKLNDLFTMVGTNGRNDMRWSDVGTLPDFNQFTGTVTFQSQAQGFDTVLTPIEFAGGIQVERKLFDDDQFNVMDQKPRRLGAAASRTREKDGARILNNAFSVDTFFYNNSEGVALASNSHTTNSGASTATGFDNLVTTALSATAVAAARIQMVGFRGDQAERISVQPSEIWYPPDLFETAWEIVNSAGKLNVANNNRNVIEGQYLLHEWNYMTDANNWFMIDGTNKRNNVFWSDRIPLEFGSMESFETFVAKWRAYMRYGNAWTNWRWLLGAQVS